MSMNPEVKAQWVADLRSGNFPQGTGLLHRQHSKEATGHTFCCLGVLCESAVAAGVVERVDITNLGPSYDGIFQYRAANPEYNDVSHHVLPYAVEAWAELDEADPGVVIRGNYKRLSQHNDQGASFAEIADAIEQQL